MLTADRLGFAEQVEIIPAYAWRPWNGWWTVLKPGCFLLIAVQAHNGILVGHSLDTSTSPLTSRSGLAASAASSLTASPTAQYSTTLSRSFAASSTSEASSSANASHTSSATSSGPASASTGNKQSASQTKYGPIVGGIVGGIIFLVLFILLIRYFHRRSGNTQSSHQAHLTKSSPRGRSQSILGMFGMAESRNNSRRVTELMSDPRSFASPRPAPRAPPHSSYVTTTERLRGRPVSEEEMSDLMTDGLGKDYLRGPPVTSDSILLVRQSGLEYGEPPESGNPPDKVSFVDSPLPITASQDFSRPPTRGISTTQTLPSLYDVSTAVPRYNADSELFSPASRYPITERPESGSTVGAALGSGRRVRESLWGRRLSVRGRGAPVLPRGVSDESQNG